MKPLSKDDPALLQVGKVGLQVCYDWIAPALLGSTVVVFIGAGTWLDYLGPLLFIGMGLVGMIAMPVAFYFKNRAQGTDRNGSSRESWPGTCATSGDSSIPYRKANDIR